MKRYERMSKEDIIKAYDSVHLGCDKCKASGSEICGSGGCVHAIEKWLNEEIVIEKVPRFTTIKTVEDLLAAENTFHSACQGRDCTECSFGDVDESLGRYRECFAEFLLEEIERERLGG